MIVIADTTPINYLIFIDEPKVLHELYGRVILPTASLTRCNAPQEGPGLGV
jgi:predicted nucleic acid-binding protein